MWACLSGSIGRSYMLTFKHIAFLCRLSWSNTGMWEYARGAISSSGTLTSCCLYLDLLAFIVKWGFSKVKVSVSTSTDSQLFVIQLVVCDWWYWIYTSVCLCLNSLTSACKITAGCDAKWMYECLRERIRGVMHPSVTGEDALCLLFLKHKTQIGVFLWFFNDFLSLWGCRTDRGGGGDRFYKVFCLTGISKDYN